MITAKRKPRGRPFPNGVSGNPGGRPKSQISHLIRKRTDGGKELVDFVFSLFRDKKANIKLRFDACTWLADRGWGKPQQSVELGAPDTSDWNPVVILPAQSEGWAGRIMPDARSGKKDDGKKAD